MIIPIQNKKLKKSEKKIQKIKKTNNEPYTDSTHTLTHSFSKTEEIGSLSSPLFSIMMLLICRDLNPVYPWLYLLFLLLLT